jgi:hypothetical protein
MTLALLWYDDGRPFSVIRGSGNTFDIDALECDLE